MTFSRILSVAAVAALVSIPAANAQFGGMPGMPGMGMPGTGGPGFGAPPPPAAGPPPACQQLIVLRDEYQKNGQALSAANEKARTQHKPPDMETCKLFKVFQASQAKFIRGMADNQATCGVPPAAVKAAQEEQGRVAQVAKQVCEIAEHPRPSGPTLSDALNSAPTLPDVDNTKRGIGTFDTLDGTKPLVR